MAQAGGRGAPTPNRVAQRSLAPGLNLLLQPDKYPDKARGASRGTNKRLQPHAALASPQEAPPPARLFGERESSAQSVAARTNHYP